MKKKYINTKFTTQILPEIQNNFNNAFDDNVVFAYGAVIGFSVVFFRSSIVIGET